ncbi:MAG: DUF502 domain-containing protein [Verrucomicrobiaceae bacterium]|nr:DUF502 domain-containing protein [Verrucomicrobiaceae bacterium]
MFKKLGNYFLTGLFIALPLAVTVFLMLFLIRNIGAPVSEFALIPILEYFDKTVPTEGIRGIAVDFFSMIVVIIIIALLGLLSKFIVARMMLSLSEKAINKIPFVGLVYRTVKQIVDTFSKQNKAVFQKAVLVEFPRKGAYSIGFLTSDTVGEISTVSQEKLLNVFVPTTPNPTSGFLIIVEEKEVKILDMSVGDAMKLIISGGAVAPEWKKKQG